MFSDIKNTLGVTVLSNIVAVPINLLQLKKLQLGVNEMNGKWMTINVQIMV